MATPAMPPFIPTMPYEQEVSQSPIVCTIEPGAAARILEGHTPPLQPAPRDRVPCDGRGGPLSCDAARSSPPLVLAAMGPKTLAPAR
jgi:hypothetical protein